MKKTGKRQAKKKQRRIYQERAYITKEDIPRKTSEWWEKLRSSNESPTDEQEAFLQCIIKRCEDEKKELATLQVESMAGHAGKQRARAKGKKRKPAKDKGISEPKRICLV